MFFGKAQITRKHVADLQYQPEVIKIHGGAENDENLLIDFFDVLATQLTLHAGYRIHVEDIKNKGSINGCGFWNVIVTLPDATRMKYQCWVFPGRTAGFSVATLAND